MPTTPARLRVVTYNILLGGHGRGERIAAVLDRCDADVVALQEANDVDLVRSLAQRLGMRMIVAKPNDASKLNLAVLTRLPVTRWRAHRHPGRMLRAHLVCELDVQAPGLSRLRIHNVHLAARFGEKNKGEARRLRELDAILGDVARSGPTSSSATSTRCRRARRSPPPPSSPAWPNCAAAACWCAASTGWSPRWSRPRATRSWPRRGARPVSSRTCRSGCRDCPGWWDR
jgi:endonuclease/exonuclease/phosphatase family metal-dependent hydrolase